MTDNNQFNIGVECNCMAATQGTHMISIMTQFVDMGGTQDLSPSGVILGSVHKGRPGARGMVTTIGTRGPKERVKVN